MVTYCALAKEHHTAHAALEFWSVEADSDKFTTRGRPARA